MPQGVRHSPATRYNDDDPAKGVAAQRPWCAYPATARFAGKGAHGEAANFTCKTAGP